MPPPGCHISTVITPALSFALVTVEMAKDYLGISASDTSQDGKIGQQIAQVSSSINTYCDRIFVQQTYRDQFRSPDAWLNYGSPLIVGQRPIVVSSVTIDGVANSLWEIDALRGRLYALDSGGGFSSWAGMVTIVDYQGGYQVIPEDIQGAALCWLSYRWTRQASQLSRDPALRTLIIPDVVSETYDTSFGTTESYSNTSSAVPPEVRDTLDNYRLWPA